mmetsp:Transcript_24473/g.28147  ORF Transcript_24473/g.28147 Transcript_24473/m.28147 type:complete len:94 (-) Transcript_24473:11-292(-)
MEEMQMYLASLTKSIEPPDLEDETEDAATKALWRSLLAPLEPSAEGNPSVLEMQTDEYRQMGKEELEERAKELELMVIRLDVRQSNVISKGIL